MNRELDEQSFGMISYDDIGSDVPDGRESVKNSPEDICAAILTEYYRATSLHGSFNSTHEGYAIIKEEVDELWDEVKKNGTPKALREEAIQIAAMAIRFCADLTKDE